jgi:hypothetical protein
MNQISPAATSIGGDDMAMQTLAVIFALAILCIAVGFYTDSTMTAGNPAMGTGSPARTAVMDPVWPLRKP